MPSTVSADEELLTGDQVYQYLLPRSPGLVPVKISFEAEDDSFFANRPSTAETDFHELSFPGLLPLVDEPTVEDSNASAQNQDHSQIGSRPDSNSLESDDLENEAVVDRVQNPDSDSTLQPVPRPPDQESENSTRRDIRRSKLKWDVPIVLAGSEVLACPDTGSEQNILSKEIATQLGILDLVDSSRSGRFVLGNGRDVQSLGAVDMELYFSREPQGFLKCMFHVFESLIRPAILGGVFLRRTETLTKHRQSRLRQRLVQSSTRLQVMHLGAARERFRCYVDGSLVAAHADTGSEMDVVSREFVRKSSQRPRALQDPLPVEFADGSIGWISHQIFTRFSANLERPKSEWAGKWFYVLDDLPCEILLGEETLDHLDAFNRETSFAMEVLDADGIELCTIFWASHLEHKMANVLGFNWKGRTTKRKNDTDEAANRVAEVSLAFDDPLLADVDPKFRQWVGEMLSGKEVRSDQLSLPHSIDSTLLNALDGWEMNRRSQTKHQSGSTEQVLEEQRQLVFDSSRETVLLGLRRAALPPLDEAISLLSSSFLPSPHSHPATPPPTTESGPSGSHSLHPDTENGVRTHPHRCPIEGCLAPPFQTSYLLNCHMNVHVPGSVHFCPVNGCPRGPGGMGFKRKNECDRHQLVHLSPGYVCPFCPPQQQQQQKYPRPDNLQRHVRLHHPDIAPDNPPLRSVLNRGIDRVP
ncbi:uncharacterized protein PV07_03901 [Cladophialophora immunda]|uniref:C2H2-type domain-containing protein n=1 Tax=Cladophialophora immunda TaxID=569365 RepID=A0A0D2CM88_9EURO|nr:uncharacterized protein PV07_03901 [Cladophialophora immunda]KIW32348.1 hypothetical protein PV07_03901 [Cladophialophora immunda]